MNWNDYLQRNISYIQQAVIENLKKKLCNLVLELVPIHHG